jgi:hypothetical protein
MSELDLLQLKVPKELTAELNTRLNEVLLIHLQEVTAHEAQATTEAMNGQSVDLSTVNRKNKEFKARKSKLTIQNLVRILLRAGLDQTTSPQDMMRLMEAHGVTKGRPKNGV